MFSEDKYQYVTNKTYLDYEFESIGPNGVIKKVARFSAIGKNVFNFGFGDLDELTGEISDTVVSNNGNGDKVLMTVANIIYDFTDVYFGAAVFIQGTTPGRTRRSSPIAIENVLVEANNNYEADAIFLDPVYAAGSNQPDRNMIVEYKRNPVIIKSALEFWLKNEHYSNETGAL